MKQTHFQYLLGCLAEECGEVIQIREKIARFGIGDVWDNKEKNPDGHSLRDRLLFELNDVYAVAEMLEELVDGTPTAPNTALMDKKRARVLRYMEYSRGKGLVE